MRGPSEGLRCRHSRRSVELEGALLLQIHAEHDVNTRELHRRRDGVGELRRRTGVLGVADELKVKYRVDVIRVSDDDEAREIALTLNSDRRQLTAEQHQEVVIDLRERGFSTTAIAGATGKSQSTIDREIGQLTRAGKLDEPDRVVGKDGKPSALVRSALRIFLRVVRFVTIERASRRCLDPRTWSPSTPSGEPVNTFDSGARCGRNVDKSCSTSAQHSHTHSL